MKRTGAHLGLGIAVLALTPALAMAQGGEAATQAASVTATPLSWWIAPIGATLAIIMAWVCYKLMLRAPEGNEKMKEIAAAVRTGAFAYLRRQYKVVSIVFIILALLFTVLAFLGVQNPFVPVAFLTGGFFSGLCGFIGMNTATQASNRTAEGARHSLNRGLQVAFRSGAVMGLVVVGFGLLDISLWYFLLNYIYDHNVFGLAAKLATDKLGIGWVVGETVNNPDFVHGKLVEITTTMITFGMGASTQALFARVGGGIFTKAADVGADLVGKVEAGIPEDDPRNPATIADNVGDNVGDVAGMGADLYESYCGSILATAALGAALPMVAGMTSTTAVIAPMIVAGIGCVLSVAGIFAVRAKEDASQQNLLRALLIGTLGSSVLILVAVCAMAYFGFMSWGMVGAIASGLIAGVIIGQATEYYTSDAYGPTKGIADQTRMGPATTILAGISSGMLSTFVPVVTICIATLAAYGFSGGFSDDPYAVSQGLYGIAFAAVGMLATLGVTLATDAYGPIADNAGGNAEMSHLDAEVRKRTDALDSLGNTTAATGKGFAIGSAALTALGLIAAYIEEVRLWLGKLANQLPDKVYEFPRTKMAFFNGSTAPTEGADKIAALKSHGFEVMGTAHAQIGDFMKAYDVNLMNPLVICGLMIGAMMSFIFCALAIQAVGRAAGRMVEEVRRQFKEKPGIMTGADKPDYARCVEISTAGAQRAMLLPALLAIIVPLATGMILGVQGIVGVLAGGMATGFALACMLNNSGGAWDNAKKFIEKGNYGGKRSDPHKAAVVGDTVGDPFKDTAGPSLNILIKLMSMVAVVFAGVVVKFSPYIGQWLGIR